MEAVNRKSKAMLDSLKTEQRKRRRVQLKRSRVMDAQCHKEWSKLHGHDMYGNDDADDADDSEDLPRVGVKHPASKCRCGSTTHKSYFTQELSLEEEE